MVRALLFELSRRSGEISAAKPTLISGGGRFLLRWRNMHWIFNLNGPPPPNLPAQTCRDYASLTFARAVQTN